MIFTSYFAKSKKFPENFIPVSISQYPPKGYEGLECKTLAPTKAILFTYKNSSEPDAIKEETYTKSYKEDVLSNADFKSLLMGLQSQLHEDILDSLETDNIWDSHNVHLVLTCFEKSGSFCHRNIVSEKMKEQGIPCRELDDVDLMRMGYELGFKRGHDR